MDFKVASTITSDEIFKELDSSTRGLSESQVNTLIKNIGPNKIASSETTTWEIFIRQFKSPFTYLLFAASVLSLLLGEVLDGAMIALFVIINSLLSFYQEYRSEQTVKLLKKYLSPKIRVLRDRNEENLDTSLLVPGDIIIFEPGDIIPADCRFIEDYNLVVDETVLTGESIPVTKTSDALGGEPHDIYSATNIGFSGTVITSGRGKAIVFATGEHTNFAGIVKLAGNTKRVSSFEKELSKFSKFTLWVVLATLLFIIITSVALKPNPSLTDLVLFAIALAVSVIPETLPAVMTFCLSIGAKNLTNKGVVVKRLTSVEDLGALQVLATDKTGTLTENNLAIDEIKSIGKEDLLLFSNLASNFTDNTRNAQNNAFDLALKKGLSKEQIILMSKFEKVSEIPFDPGRKRVTTLISNGKDKYIVSRGIPEDIMDLCVGVKNKTALSSWIIEKGKDGKRSLGIAIKKVSSSGAKDITVLEKDLQFLGLISFIDPIKKSAYEAITKAKNLGVQVKIITGDSPEVAASVAKEIGLINSMNEVITGAEFEKLGIEAKHKAVSDYNVFARIVPEQKHQIITLLKEKFYVGFLGEGINDAPALKAANVGVVVDGAADVAKEAADIVLLKKDLEVIMDGVMEGRRVFANTSKYITATMASNFGNFFAIALIAPFINFLPMLPLQILLIDLLSDFPLIMVATDNVEPEVLKAPKRYGLKSFAISALSFGFISTAFDFAVFNTFVKLGEQGLHTYWFIESILSELLIIFTVRTAKPFFKSIAPSKPIVLLTFVTIFLTVLVPFTPLGRSIFGFIRPEMGSLATVFALVGIYLLTNEVAKFFLRKFSKMEV